MREMYKKIDNDYAVCSNGDIVSLKYGKVRLLKPDTDRGYKRVTFSNGDKAKKHSVHRLVASAFLPNPENKPCVNHIDGDPSNNELSNLEWCTYSENEIHSYKVLKKVNAIRKLTGNDIRYIRLTGVTGRGGNVSELAKYYKVHRTTILNVLKNKYYV